MELRQYLNVVGKWWWLVILSVVIAGSASFLASRASTPIYLTKTTLMVGNTMQNPEPNQAQISTGQQLAYTYVQLATREPVLKGVIDRLGLQISWETLAGQVSANIVNQTQLLEIRVIDTDPYRAKVLADAVAHQLILQSPAGANTTVQEASFIREQLDDLKSKIEISQAGVLRLQQELDAANSASQIQNLQNQVNILETKVSEWQNVYSQLLLSLQGGEVNTLSVIEEATVPTVPIRPQTKMNVLLASVIGLILSVGGAILVEYLDDTVKSVDDVTRMSKLPTLGTIPRIQGENYAGKLVAALHPRAPAVESYRVLRTNLQYSSLDKPIHTLMMTGPGPSEGKSICIANLAVVLAQSGVKVILVDADLRRPVQHEIFNLDNQIGLGNAVLRSNIKATRLLRNTSIENLRVITSGSLPPNPAELLGSDRIKEIIAELKMEADIMLFDSPPVLPVADALILGPQLDGVILVNDVGRTRLSEAKRAIEEMFRVQSNLLGVVLNRVPMGGAAYYYHYYNKNDKGDDQHDTGNNHRLGWFERIFAGRLRSERSEKKN